MKKYKLRCAYCGATIEKWEWLLKLQLILTTHYYHHCPVCHHKTSYLYIFHLRHDSLDDKEKIFNKGKLFDDRI